MIERVLTPEYLFGRIEDLERRLKAFEGRRKPLTVPSEHWLKDLRANPLYQHVNFDAELAKIERWKLKPGNANRQVTRKFLINWLNKIDVPVELGLAKAKPPAPPPRIDPIARGQWKQTYGDPKQYGYD